MGRSESQVSELVWHYQKELQFLISGVQGAINIDDLRRNTVYSNYSEDDEPVQFFWQILEEFSPELQRKFLFFVTSSYNVRPEEVVRVASADGWNLITEMLWPVHRSLQSPLLGFSHLSPKFSIIRADSAEDRLPTAATCMNLLRLPSYASLELMRSKLQYAVEANAGFEMS